MRETKKVDSTIDHAESAIMASIVCATFNQQKYIERALDSFLSQETNFNFEIIVHDDASTDGTAKIVSTYAAKHPHQIRPILQSKNQYSQGGFKPSMHASTFARGKYIAFCEGDDYWLDQSKLQKQIDALERNPEVDFSFHAGYILTDDSERMQLSWTYGQDRRIFLDELLNARVGSFAPTSSYLFRASVFDQLPAWFMKEAPVSDFFLERYAALRGGAFYFSQPMSVYRSHAVGSWTLKIKNSETAYRGYLEAMTKSLLLMEPDFAQFSNQFRQFCARFYLKYSIKELLGGNEYEFNELLLKSVEQWKFVSRKQALIYRLRKYPSLVKLMCRIGRTHTD